LEPVAIRQAGTDDAAVLAGLICAFRDYLDEPEPSDGQALASVHTLLADPATEFLLAGEPPQAFAALRFRHSVWTGSEDCWLEDLYVAADARRTGLGRALTEACIARAREHGAKRIQLDANERNETAIALYESLGFRCGREHRYGGAKDLYFTKPL